MNQISTEETRAKQLELANEAACALSTALMTFLSLSLYVGITTASTTDEMLVKATTVTLSFFNVSISIVGFYALAPWLVVLHHGTGPYICQRHSCAGVRSQWPRTARSRRSDSVAWSHSYSVRR
jgi:hypothetical protein